MEKFLIDTHALLWHLQDDHRLSQKARSLMDKTSTGDAILYLSIISLMEIDYLTLYSNPLLSDYFQLIFPGLNTIVYQSPTFNQ